MQVLALIVVLLFPLSEIALGLFKRARRSQAAVEDRGSLRLLWIVIGASVGVAIVLRAVAATRMHLPPATHAALAVLLTVAGLAIRWVAILTLGRLFTVDVAVHRDHGLVESGIYRHVRHPSYTGLLLAFLGLGVYYGNWLSLVALLVPIGWALAHRIAVEEAALGHALGSAYTAYCSRTWRLVPGLY